MTNITPLTSLEVHIFRGKESDPTHQSQDTLETVQQVGHEITNLYSECRRIKQIEGEPISIVGLKLTGETSVDYVEITFIKDGDRLSKKYSISDFYNI